MMKLIDIKNPDNLLRVTVRCNSRGKKTSAGEVIVEVEEVVGSGANMHLVGLVSGRRRMSFGAGTEVTNIEYKESEKCKK